MLHVDSRYPYHIAFMHFKGHTGQSVMLIGPDPNVGLYIYDTVVFKKENAWENGMQNCILDGSYMISCI
jgi:hypothetical protein